MATVKNISGDYTITCDNGTGKLTLNADLDVYGNITYVDELKVSDDFIIVAGNNTGNITSMGMIAQKSTSTFAGLRFNTITSNWEISPNVTEQGAPITPYSTLVSGNVAVAGLNTEIQYNDSGSFGASATLTFDKSSNTLTLTGHQVFGNIGLTPAPVANSVAIYNKEPGSGATGLYVIGTSVNDELINATKAKLYSIIF